LRENQVFEWVSYGMAVVLFLFGLVLLAVGVAPGEARGLLTDADVFRAVS
jgi:hypothetical protein